jgi:hypothetical protein
MDRPGGTVLVIESVVGAGPAIQRRSVMRRKTFNLAALISLLLCIATIVFTAVRSIREPQLYQIEIRDDAVARHSLILLALIPTFLVLPGIWVVVRSMRRGQERGFDRVMSKDRAPPHNPPMQRTGGDGIL